MPERTESIERRASSAAEHDDELLVRPAKDLSHKLGRTLVSHFYMVAKTASMFDFANVITREAVVTFLGTLKEIFSHDPQVVLTMASDCLFVNETRLKIDFEGFAAFKYVTESMKAREVGSIAFRREIEDRGLETFLRLFTENDGRSEGARDRIREGLRDAGVDAIELEEIRDLADRPPQPVKDGHRETSINTYFKSIFVAKQFIQNFRGSRGANIHKSKRLVHSIVDLVAQDDSTLLALTQIKNFDNFLFTHCANVCVLSVALGQTLGLDRGLLANLGLAALLHDVGMTEIPREIMLRREDLTPEERRTYEQHPAIGARGILKSQGVSEASIRCILAAFEHHVLEDGHGFPGHARRLPRSLISRIISIVDFYDAITTPDDDGGPIFTAEEALRLMANEGRDVFDPALVKLFVNTIGAYPLGTVVRLDTGETAIVHRKSPNSSQQSRPIVKIIEDEFGVEMEPVMVDLNERTEDGRYARTIVETISTSLYFEAAREFTELV